MSLRSLSKLFASLSLFACTSLFAAPLTIDVAGIKSVGEIGDAGNTVFTFNVGANAHITSFAYQVNLTAIDSSWLSEIGLAFTDSSELAGVVFNPGVGDQFPDTADYAGSAELSDFGLDFRVGADGILRLEFFEDFDDFDGADAMWNFGTLTFGVTPETLPPNPIPEPASIALLGGGLTLLAATRRRRAGRSITLAD